MKDGKVISFILNEIKKKSPTPTNDGLNIFFFYYD